MWSRRPRVRVPSLTPQESLQTRDFALDHNLPESPTGTDSGTDASATTTGTTAEPGGDEPPIRFRGDEPELYLAFNHELVKLIERDVRAAPEDIEDACSFAWIQFFRYQPDRERNWKGWLYRTAQRETWRLNAQRFGELSIVPDDESHERGTTREPADPRDRLEERLEFVAAMKELSRLPPRWQQVVIVNSQVWKQVDVAEILGVNPTRINYLLRRVSERLDQMAQQRHELERPVASPRAARLRELEDDPPKWLMESIGRAPTRNKTAGTAVLAWRRAALAIDDYRRDHGWHAPDAALGPQPLAPAARRAHERAKRAVEQVREERVRRRGLQRER